MASSIKDSYDVVVIGAGIGGLTAAALLAKRKKSVLVLEQAGKPGGYCSSFEDRGCTFDIGLSYLLGCELGGPIYEVLDELGLRDAIDFIRLKPAIRIMGQDYDISIVSPSGFADTLADYFPMETPAIRQFMAECRAVGTEMRSLSRASMDTMSAGMKAAFSLYSFFRYRRAWVYGKKSRQDVIDAYFHDPKLKVIVLSVLTHFDPGVVARLSMSELGAKEDFYYPRGGAQALANVLVDGIGRYRGEVCLNTRVDKISVQGGRAVGVVLEDGRQIAAQQVVSDMDARSAFLNLVGEEHLSGRFLRSLNGRRLSRSAFIVSMGVSLNLKAMGFDCASIVYNPVDEVDDLYGSDPSKCALNINLPSIVESWRSWGSTTAIQLTATFPYDAVTDWRQEEEEVATRLIASAERIIPNLSKHVISKNIMSPAVLESATGNTQGAILGWYPSPGRSSRSQKTPIRNLYQAGQWSLPGGGVPAAFISGRHAAALVLKGK